MKSHAPINKSLPVMQHCKQVTGHCNIVTGKKEQPAQNN
jgi:hypothetical protein